MKRSRIKGCRGNLTRELVRWKIEWRLITFEDLIVFKKSSLELGEFHWGFAEGGERINSASLIKAQSRATPRWTKSSIRNAL